MSRVIGRKVGLSKAQLSQDQPVRTNGSTTSPSIQISKNTTTNLDHTLSRNLSQTLLTAEPPLKCDSNSITPSSSPSKIHNSRLSAKEDQETDFPTELKLSSPFLINTRTRSPSYSNINNTRSRSVSDLRVNGKQEDDSPSPFISLSPLRMEMEGERDGIKKERISDRSLKTSDLSKEDNDDDDDEEGVLPSTTGLESLQAVTDLVCPICQEAMITLFQLNQHIDDVHLNGKINPTPVNRIPRTNSESFTSPLQDQSLDLSMILKKTNEYKVKIQDAIPKQLQSRLDSFLENNTNNLNIAQLSLNSTNNTLLIDGQSQRNIEVTRRHWRKQIPNQRCSHENCRKVLNLKSGVIHCRSCGFIYCGEHTRYWAKLTENAEFLRHSPEDQGEEIGIWSRICQKCYTSQTWYEDLADSRDLTARFKKLRDAKSEESKIQEVKLTNRIKDLIKGLQTLADLTKPQRSLMSTFASIKSTSSKRSNLEKSLVPWQDETHITNCPYCMQSFGYLLRKHHCRGCGIVVCGDNLTNCSKNFEVQELLNMLDEYIIRVDDAVKGHRILLCKGCSGILVSAKRSRNGEILRDLGIFSSIFANLEILLNHKKATEVHSARLSQLITNLRSTDSATPTELLQVEKLRTCVTSSLKQYCVKTKEILTIRPKTADQQSLLFSIRQTSTEFIHETTTLIKSLQKLLKELPTTTDQSLQLSSESSSSSPIPPLLGASPESLVLPARQISIEQAHHIKSLRESLLVLHEQTYLIQGQIEQSTNQRKFDEVTVLKGNIEELEREVDGIRTELKELGDEGL